VNPDTTKYIDVGSMGPIFAGVHPDDRERLLKVPFPYRFTEKRKQRHVSNSRANPRGGLRKGRIESWDYVTESGFRLLTSKVSVSASPPIGGGFFLLVCGWSSRWFRGRGRMDRRTEQRIEKALATPRTRNANGQPRTLYRNPYFALLGPRVACYRG
jgi:hypothetical protein